MFQLLLTDVSAIIKIPGHSKLGCPEAKGNHHLANTSTRNATLKETNSSEISVILIRDIFPCDNLEKLARETQQLASEKEKQD